MGPLLASWVTFALGRQDPHQETRSLTLCLPLLCSWATLWTCTWTEPLQKIWKLGAVPVLGLGAQPFFLRGVQSPSCRFKHHWQVSFSWGYYVLELKLQFQLRTSLPTYRAEVQVPREISFGVQANCEMERRQLAQELWPNSVQRPGTDVCTHPFYFPMRPRISELSTKVPAPRMGANQVWVERSSSWEW